MEVSASQLCLALPVEEERLWKPSLHSRAKGSKYLLPSLHNNRSVHILYYMCLVCVNPLVILLGVSLSSSSCGTGIHLFVPIDASSGALVVRSILPLCKFAPSLLIRSILLSSRPLPLRPPALVSACLLSPLLCSRRTRFCVHVCIQLCTHVYTVVYTRVHRGDHYYFTTSSRGSSQLYA